MSVPRTSQAAVLLPSPRTMLSSGVVERSSHVAGAVGAQTEWRMTSRSNVTDGLLSLTFKHSRTFRTCRHRVLVTHHVPL
jgi:hypothetical protein